MEMTSESMYGGTVVRAKMFGPFASEVCLVEEFESYLEQVEEFERGRIAAPGSGMTSWNVVLANVAARIQTERHFF
ncbi:hypothetical protein AOLI_G00289850 [Acnodon oligacanthus]